MVNSIGFPVLPALCAESKLFVSKRRSLNRPCGFKTSDKLLLLFGFAQLGGDAGFQLQFRGSNGLEMKSSAPIENAMTLFTVSLLPVRMMTGMSLSFHLSGEFGEKFQAIAVGKAEIEQDHFKSSFADSGLFGFFERGAEGELVFVERGFDQNSHFRDCLLSPACCASSFF